MRRSMLLLGWVALHGAVALAADQQPYRVDFAPTGQESIDSLAKAASQLQVLRESGPVDPFGLIARARGDGERLITVLKSYGYYQGSVSITINGLPLNDPTLGDVLVALPKDKPARARVTFDLGPQFHLRRVDLEGHLPGEFRSSLPLEPGAPAIASEVLAAGRRLEAALQNHGYAFATVAPPIATEYAQDHVLDVTFNVEAGPKVRIGAMAIEGLTRMRESFVRRRLLIHADEPYDAAKVEKARADLLGMGVFSTVTVKLGSAADDQGRVPITFTVRERLRHSVGVNAAYSSDLGGSGGVSWSDRDVFGGAQQLDLSASAINLGGTATTGPGYDINAKYRIPDFGHRDQTLQLAVRGIRQALQAYDQTAQSAALTLSRRLSSLWSVTVGISGSRESVLQQGVSIDYTLAALPVSGLYDTTHLTSLLVDPTGGVRMSLNLTPTLSLGRPNATFLITQASLSGYLDLHHLIGTPSGRSVVAARAMAGVAEGASDFSLPPDQRFYAGGSGTVRGYRYQSVGPEFADGTPIGGTAMSAFNLEWRQRFGSSFGMAVFADGGTASQTLDPLSGAFRIGVGVGVRYYTAIGPLRLDIAFPANPRPNDDRFEVYIGLGQAF